MGIASVIICINKDGMKSRRAKEEVEMKDEGWTLVTRPTNTAVAFSRDVT